MSIAYINHEILSWARNRYCINGESLPNFHKDYLKWEQGISKPTFKQAQDLAKKLHIPFGFLYLSSPPQEKAFTADLRRVDDRPAHEFSVDLKATIEDALKKQDWYREKLIEQGEGPLPFIGKFSMHARAEEIAADMTDTLGMDIAHRDPHSNLLAFLTQQAEQAGILVLRNGKVGMNTHRPLNIEEFRGFALSDPRAPLVFVNSSDYPAAQIFTLAHELAHLWIGTEGVSNENIGTVDTHNDIETLCNMVAVEVLVPRTAFQKAWHTATGTLDERCNNLRKNTFHVSTIVLARRALDSGLIKQEDFGQYYSMLKHKWKEKKGTSSGGSFDSTFPIANSKTFTDALCQAIYSEHTLLRNGARLLNVKPSTVHAYAERMGIV